MTEWFIIGILFVAKCGSMPCFQVARLLIHSKLVFRWSCSWIAWMQKAALWTYSNSGSWWNLVPYLLLLSFFVSAVLCEGWKVLLFLISYMKYDPVPFLQQGNPLRICSTTSHSWVLNWQCLLPLKAEFELYSFLFNSFFLCVVMDMIVVLIKKCSFYCHLMFNIILCLWHFSGMPSISKYCLC